MEREVRNLQKDTYYIFRLIYLKAANLFELVFIISKPSFKYIIINRIEFIYIKDLILAYLFLILENTRT